MKKYVLGAVLILVLAGSAFFLNTKLNSSKASSAPADDAEVAALVAAVGKLMVLPLGESPTIATVSDPEKLKDQAFFANANKGDKVLLYANAKKAIMYSPGQNKIIEVAPLTNEPAPQNSAPAPKQ